MIPTAHTEGGHHALISAENTAYHNLDELREHFRLTKSKVTILILHINNSSEVLLMCMHFASSTVHVTWHMFNSTSWHCDQLPCTGEGTRTRGRVAGDWPGNIQTLVYLQPKLVSFPHLLHCHLSYFRVQVHSPQLGNQSLIVNLASIGRSLYRRLGSMVDVYLEASPDLHQHFSLFNSIKTPHKSPREKPVRLLNMRSTWGR